MSCVCGVHVVCRCGVHVVSVYGMYFTMCVYICVCFVFSAVFCGVFDLDVVVLRHASSTPPSQDHF